MKDYILRLRVYTGLGLMVITATGQAFAAPAEIAVAYRVRDKDTVARIARTYNLDADQLLHLNPQLPTWLKLSSRHSKVVKLKLPLPQPQRSKKNRGYQRNKGKAILQPKLKPNLARPNHTKSNLNPPKPTLTATVAPTTAATKTEVKLPPALIEFLQAIKANSAGNPTGSRSAPSTKKSTTAVQFPTINPNVSPKHPTQGRIVLGVTKFIWPVQGRIVSNFGPQVHGLHNDGINITQPTGSPVQAAAPGEVVYVGNHLKSLGNMLMLRHGGGLFTIYAHLHSAKVHKGMQVKQGQVIAQVGNSGNVDRPQLHFQVRRKCQAVNPLYYLPMN